MNRWTSSFIGGLAGAVALNVLHQAIKQFDSDAPRVDLIGEEAVVKGFEKTGFEPPVGDSLFNITLGADLISNAAYYSMIGMGKKKYLPYHGIAHGFCAGIGTLTLTAPLGLNDAPVNRTTRTKVMTVAWYTFGGLVAGLAMSALRGKK